MTTTPEPSSSASALPTGESTTGVVRRQPAGDEPVLERRVATPPEAPEAAPPAAAVAPAAAAPAAAAPAAAPPAPATPAPVVTASVAPAAAPVQASVAQPALQESPKVSIPLRMNQLHSENQRLRDEIDALEQSLKSPPN